MQASATLGEIAERLGGELIGDPATAHRRASGRSSRPTPVDHRLPRQSALRRSSSPASQRRLRHRRPGVRDAALARGAAIVTPDPYLYFARLTQWWAARDPAAGRCPAIHARRGVDPARARSPRDASIGAVRRGRGGRRRSAPASSIGAHAFVGRDCRLGAGTRLAPRVTLMFETRPSASAASSTPAPSSAPTASASRPTAGRWEKIEQLGRVRHRRRRRDRRQHLHRPRRRSATP